jgi:copper transport protein
MVRFSLRALLAAAAGCLSLFILVPAPAAAHAYLVRSAPADGAVLDRAPEVLMLHFTESVELGATHLDIVDGDGRRFAPTSVNVRSTEPGGDNETPADVVVGLPPLPPNTYHITWKTLSSDDLHATTGNLVIGVQRTVTAAHSVPGPGGPAPLETTLRGIVLLGLSTVLGGLAMALLLGLAADVAGLRRRLLDIAISGGLLAAIAAPALLASQVAAGPSGLFWREASSARWMVRELGVVALVVAAVWLRSSAARPSVVRAGFVRTRLVRSDVVPPLGLAAVGACCAAIGTALLGHTSGGFALSTVSGSVHVLAAGGWAGGVIAGAVALVPLVRAGDDRGRQIGVLLRAFAALAVVCLTTLTVTGLLMVGDQVSTVDALLTTPYGIILLGKVAAVGVAGLLGLRTSRQLRRPGTRIPVRGLAVEAVTLAIAIALAGALASAGPANGPRFAGTSSAAGGTGSRALTVVPQVSGQVADLVDTVAIRPNLPGRNVVTVVVNDTRRPPLGPITGVSVVLRSPEGGQHVHPVVRTSDGGWAVTVDDIQGAGEWTVSVTVARDGLPPVTDPHQWVVGSGAAAAVPVVSAASLAPATVWLAGIIAVLACVAGGIWLRRRRRAPAAPAVPSVAGVTSVETMAEFPADLVDAQPS